MHMYAKRVSANEQYRLIMECRNSGLSDYQWCKEHDIIPGTFYNWVKRLRQKGCQDIPAAAGRSMCETSNKNEVVQIAFQKDKCSPVQSSTQMISDNQFQAVSHSAIELSVGNANIRIPNGTDPILLEQTLRLLMEFSC